MHEGTLDIANHIVWDNLPDLGDLSPPLLTWLHFFRSCVVLLMTFVVKWCEQMFEKGIFSRTIQLNI
jgi:hypothetical protein